MAARLGPLVGRASGRSRALKLDPRGEAVLGKAVVRLLGIGSN
jgi:hypothetical protein